MNTFHKVFGLRLMFLALICAFAVVCMALPSDAWAQNAVLILKDKERNLEEPLFEGPSGSGCFVYKNARFNYSVHVPRDITRLVAGLPDNGDGLLLSSQDGKAKMRVSGGYAEFVEGGLQGSYENAVQEAGRQVLRKKITQNEQQQEWELVWKKDTIMHKRKFVIKGEVKADCEFSYPLADDRKYGAITDSALGAFTIKDE